MARRFNPYSSRGRKYKGGEKLFGDILGAGLNIGGAIVKETMKSSSQISLSNTAQSDEELEVGCTIATIIIFLAIGIGLIVFGFSIGWSIFATIGVLILILPIIQIKEWISNIPKLKEKRNRLKDDDSAKNLLIENQKKILKESVLNFEDSVKCDLQVITTEMTTELLNSLNDYELPDEVVNLPNDNLYWYLRGVNSIREKIQKSTKGALDAKRKKGEAMGGDSRCWGMKAEHMKNLSIEERAEYRKDKIQHCVNVSATNRRAKALSNPNNKAFWYFITDYIKINGEPKPRTDYWTICAQELNKRGLTTSTGRPFTNGNACSTYCHLKQMFSE